MRAAVLALGMVGAGLVTAAPAQAATPSCWTAVSGVNTSGRVVERTLHGTIMTEQKVATAALGIPAESIVVVSGQKVSGGWVHKYQVFSPGKRPAQVDVTDLDASSTLTTKVTGYFLGVVGARHLTYSGRYYTYGVDANGNLKRWTKYLDPSGKLWLGSPKLVARGMGGLRTLSWQWTRKTSSGWADVLYGTTARGALKQFQIRWNAPTKPRIATVRKTGFASVTGLSLSGCGSNPSYASLVMIDRTHNRARWFTLRNSFTPKSSNLVNRGLTGRGADWRLHATV